MSYILDALKKSEQERGNGNIPSVQTVHTSSLNYRTNKSNWPYILIVAVILNLAAIIYFFQTKDSTNIATHTNTSTSSNNADQTLSLSQKRANSDLIKPIQQNLTPVIDTSSSVDNTNRTTISDTQRQPLKQKKTVSSTSEVATQQAKAPELANQEQARQVQTWQEESSVENFTQPEATERHSASQIQTSSNTRMQKNTSDVIDYHDLPDSIKSQLPAIIVSAHVYSDNPLQRSIVINDNFLEEGEHVLDDLILQEITKGGAILEYQGTVFSYEIVSGWQ